MDGLGLRWKLASELTEHEMQEAMYALERVDCPPPVAEGYLRGHLTCWVDFWLHWGDEPRPYHFEAEFYRLTDPGDLPVVDHALRSAGRPRAGLAAHPGQVAALVPGLVGEGELEVPEVDLGGYRQDRLREAVFVVVGQTVKSCQRVQLVAVEVVGQPVYSVVRLKAIDEIPMGLRDLLAATRESVTRPLVYGQADWEVETFGIRGLVGRGFVATQRPGELAESGLPVLGHVGDRVDKALGEQAQRRDADYLEDVLACLRIELGADYSMIRWVVSEGLPDVVFQRGKMASRPLPLAHGGRE